MEKKKYLFKELIVDSRTGLNPRKNFKLGHGDNYYITIKDIHDGEVVITDKTERIDDDAMKIINKRSRLKVGDVLFSSIGRIGETAIIREEPKNWNINESVFAFTVNKELITPEYFRWMFKAPKYKNEIERESTGSTFASIKMNKLNEMSFEIPCRLDEQIAITNELDSICLLIKNCEKRIVDLDELIKLNYYNRFENSGELQLLGPLCTICRGASPRPITAFTTNDENGVNWIKIGDVQSDAVYITKTSEKITEAGAKKSRPVKVGDFILSNSMSFGRPYILGINGCVHDGWLIISNYEKSFKPLFLYYLLRSESVQLQFEQAASGTTVHNLNSDIVKNVSVIKPSLLEQERFSSFVEKVFELRNIVQKQKASLHELLNSKIDYYFGI